MSSAVALAGPRFGVYPAQRMYPAGRFVRTMARALRAPRMGILEVDAIDLTVNRLDVEASRMNNGRYLTLMDLGRFSLIARVGFAPVMMKRRWFPLLTGVMIHFHRSLRVGRRFRLFTRCVCWDERAFYLEQWFEERERLCARAYVRAVFRAPDGLRSPADVLAACGIDEPSPAFPHAIRAWDAAEAAAFGRP